MLAILRHVCSTSTVVGFSFGHNGNNSIMTALGWNRWTIKMQYAGFSSVRYWMGMACWNIGGTGGNSASKRGDDSLRERQPEQDDGWVQVFCGNGYALASCRAKCGRIADCR